MAVIAELWDYDCCGLTLCKYIYSYHRVVIAGARDIITETGLHCKYIHHSSMEIV
jgi:hypothetical protein